MNPPPSASVTRRAFTLIELLVVISIIAVLAGILLPVAGSVMNNAKKVQAKNTELQIVSAVKSFQTDYGVYPVASGDSSNGTVDVTYGASAPLASTLMDVLRCDGYGNDLTLNPRRVVYLEMPAVKNAAKPANGIGTTDGQPYDPWGVPYEIIIDSNYDNAISNPYSANAGFNPIGTGVIVWSYGKDKTNGQGMDKNTGVALDDVISWQ